MQLLGRSFGNHLKIIRGTKTTTTIIQYTEDQLGLLKGVKEKCIVKNMFLEIYILQDMSDDGETSKIYPVGKMPLKIKKGSKKISRKFFSSEDLRDFFMKEVLG